MQEVKDCMKNYNSYINNPYLQTTNPELVMINASNIVTRVLY